MNRVLPLTTVQQAVRARVCAQCPRRTGDDRLGCQHARPCEATCPPFHNLSKLWSIASQLDPMVGHFVPALRRAIDDVERAEASFALNPGRDRRDRAFVSCLRELSGK